MGHNQSYACRVMPYREPIPRLCSKASCSLAASATLTYVYADSEAVVGPLSETKEPHGYDLCDQHAHKLSAPVGWRIVRYRPYPEAV
jgi:hypothetical protein